MNESTSRQTELMQTPGEHKQGILNEVHFVQIHTQDNVAGYDDGVATGWDGQHTRPACHAVSSLRSADDRLPRRSMNNWLVAEGMYATGLSDFRTVETVPVV